MFEFHANLVEGKGGSVARPFIMRIFTHGMSTAGVSLEKRKMNIMRLIHRKISIR